MCAKYATLRALGATAPLRCYSRQVFLGEGEEATCVSRYATLSKYTMLRAHVKGPWKGGEVPRVSRYARLAKCVMCLAQPLGLGGSGLFSKAHWDTAARLRGLDGEGIQAHRVSRYAMWQFGRHRCGRHGDGATHSALLARDCSALLPRTTEGKSASGMVAWQI